MVKTVSGSVASWPATGNVTTRPLPVLDLEQHAGGEGEDGEEGEAALLWQPNPESYQDQYKVSGCYCIFWWEMRAKILVIFPYKFFAVLLQPSEISVYVCEGK